MTDKNDGARLDKVLEVRRWKEQSEIQALVDAQEAVTEAEETLARLRAEWSTLRRGMNEASAAVVGQLQALTLMMEQLERGIELADRARNAAAHRVSRQTDSYLEAHAERRAVEKARDRRETRAQLARKEREQKRDDEIAMERYWRGDGTMNSGDRG
ncbi:flagellar export protein FliJ [Gaopeijia maritima]|uniref:Flagellar FliJ protein n=1 Tax=Gaopeijia maritima TaxID=3119007 RepID=A0ABU9ECP3_9BACT